MQQCAVREVLEETGYDISDKITSDEYLELNYDDMFVQLFIVHSISRQTPFNPQTRGEVKVRAVAATAYRSLHYGQFFVVVGVDARKRSPRCNRAAVIGKSKIQSPSLFYDPPFYQVSIWNRLCRGVSRSSCLETA